MPFLSNQKFTSAIAILFVIPGVFPKIFNLENENPANFSSGQISSIVNGVPSLGRPFYVKVLPNADDESKFCGGVIIGSRWVLTAAECVYRHTVRTIVVEFGDYTKIFHTTRTSKVYRLVIHRLFQKGRRPANNLALLATKTAFSTYSRIELCSENVLSATHLGTCGMGSTSQKQLVLAPVLMETYLMSSIFENLDIFSMKMCRIGEVCTQRLLDNSNICSMDQGSPLYTFKCESREPDCLIGVASYFLNKDEYSNTICDDGSFFSSIPYNYEWIMSVIKPSITESRWGNDL